MGARLICPVQQRKALQLNPLALSKRERKLNYSVDSYFKDAMRAGPSKTEKAPKIPRAPKQIQLCVSRHSSLLRDRLICYSILQPGLPVLPAPVSRASGTRIGCA